MKASELRIGNWLQLGEALAQVHAGDIQYIQNCNFKDISPDHRPIPLTPEILEKCGFVKQKSNDEDERDIYSIQVANNTSLYFDNTHPEHKEWYLSHEWNNNHFQNDFWAKPGHLHELQNLYFALTGEELEIKDL